MALPHFPGTRWASAVLVLLGASGAAAQIGGQTGTVPGFPQFHESVGRVTCTDEAVCDLDLGLVPANRLLMATDVMCAASSSQELEVGRRGIFRLSEEKSGEETPKNFFVVPDLSPSPDEGRNHTFEESVLSFFAGGSQPTIRFASGFAGNSSLTCKLSGSLAKKQ